MWIKVLAGEKIAKRVVFDFNPKSSHVVKDGEGTFKSSNSEESQDY